MKNRHSLKTLSSLTATTLASLAVAATSASAATVTWSAPQTITANSDILNPENVVDARNYGNAGGDIEVTVGSETVTFTNVNAPFLGAPFSTTDVFNATGTNVGSDFNDVLDSASFMGGSTNTALSFTGLIDGGDYTLQVFSTDDRNEAFGWITDLSIVGSSTTLNLGGSTRPAPFSSLFTKSR